MVVLSSLQLRAMMEAGLGPTLYTARKTFSSRSVSCSFLNSFSSIYLLYCCAF